MGNYNTGGAGTAPRPMLGAAGGAAQPILNRDSPNQIRAQPGYLGPAGGAPTEILNRPSTNEIPTRPAVRPMGGFRPIDDRRDIMDPNLR